MVTSEKGERNQIESLIDAGWSVKLVENMDEMHEWWRTKPVCRCGQALNPFEASGAGGYVNGYMLWALNRRESGAVFGPSIDGEFRSGANAVAMLTTPPKHDIIERQWLPRLGDSKTISLYERRHAGTCTPIYLADLASFDNVRELLIDMVREQFGELSGAEVRGQSLSLAMLLNVFDVGRDANAEREWVRHQRKLRGAARRAARRLVL